MKFYLILFIMFMFLFGGLGVERSLFSAYDDEPSIEETTSKKRKKKKKKRRKGRKRRKKRKKRRKKDEFEDMSYEREKPSYKKGLYGVCGLKYFMPSNIDFDSVVEAGGSSKYSNAELTHTGGVGFELGVGYRLIKYFSVEADLFLVYPIIGSDVALERSEYGSTVVPVAAGAKVIMPRLMAKGIYPFENFDFEVSAGLGYTQLLKSVDPAEEGVSMAGVSYHGSAGCTYKLDKKWSFTGSFEYVSIGYSYVDVWDTTLYDSESGESVSVSQTMMIFGVTANYIF